MGLWDSKLINRNVGCNKRCEDVVLIASWLLISFIEKQKERKEGKPLKSFFFLYLCFCTFSSAWGPKQRKMSKKLRTEGLNEFILIYIRNKYLQRKIHNFFFLLEEWAGGKYYMDPSIIVTGFVHRQSKSCVFLSQAQLKWRLITKPANWI